MVTEDEKIKERLFDKLYQRAKSKRLTETKQYYTKYYYAQQHSIIQGSYF